MSDNDIREQEGAATAEPSNSAFFDQVQLESTGPIASEELPAESAVAPEAAPEAGPEPGEKIGDTMARPTTVLPKAEPEPEEDEPKPKSGIPKLAIVLGAIAIAVIVAIVATLLVPPQLTTVQIVEDFDAAELESSQLTNSVYASNVGYEIASEEVASIEDNGADRKVAHVIVHFENESFNVAVQATVDYALVGRTWTPGEYTVDAIDATPLAPVDEGRVLADVDTLLDKAGTHGGVSLVTLYQGGDFEVRSADLSHDSMSCEVQILARRDVNLYSYSGTITAEFEFVPGRASMDAGSWRLASVTADDGAYEHSFADIRGEWRGNFQSTATSALIFDIGRCFHGKQNVATVNVTSYDVDSGRMVCDLTFVSHNHGAIPHDQDETGGDAVVTLEGVTVMLDPETLEGTYQHTGTDGMNGYYELAFRNDKGVWRLTVVSSVLNTGTWSWGTTTFTDTYILERA